MKSSSIECWGFNPLLIHPGCMSISSSLFGLLSSIPLCECITVCLTAHLLEHIAWVDSQVWVITNKAAIDIHVQIFIHTSAFLRGRSAIADLFLSTFFFKDNNCKWHCDFNSHVCMFITGNRNSIDVVCLASCDLAELSFRFCFLMCLVRT